LNDNNDSLIISKYIQGHLENDTADSVSTIDLIELAGILERLILKRENEEVDGDDNGDPEVFINSFYQNIAILFSTQKPWNDVNASTGYNTSTSFLTSVTNAGFLHLKSSLMNHSDSGTFNFVTLESLQSSAGIHLALVLLLLLTCC
jgi:hypothetical protein